MEFTRTFHDARWVDAVRRQDPPHMFVDLPETLRDTCSVVTELETDNAHGAKALRVRMDLIRTATMFLSSRPEEQAETVALARLVNELREEAVALRKRHRVVKRMVLSMMD